MTNLEKKPSDAPAWYSADEASAWASGYNSAIENTRAALSSPGERDHGADLQVLETLLASTCFGKDVCQFPPCACAKAVTDRLAARSSEPELSGLLDRLHTLQDHYSTSGKLGPENRRIFAEAADAITRLAASAQAQPTRETVLRQIVAVCEDNSAPSCDAGMALAFVRKLARDALTGDVGNSK
jgi:hypothetical protein